MRLLLGLLCLLAAVILLGVNTPVGHRTLESAARLGGVEITGLEGRFPDDLTVARITIADAKGVWLAIDGLRLDWQPTALLRHEIAAAVLTAGRVEIHRYPASGGSSSAGPFPYRVAVDQIRIDTLVLPEATLSLSGRAARQPDAVDLALSLSTPDAAGQGPATVAATLAGPLDHATLAMDITGAGNTAHIAGTLNLGAPAADLHLAIDHPTLPAAAPLGEGPVTLDLAWHPGATPEIAAHMKADTLDLAVQGAAPGSMLALDYRLLLPRLAAFAPTIAGTAGLAGRLEGPADGFTLTAQTQADITAGGIASTIGGTITATGLPKAPAGHAVLAGVSGGKPVSLDMTSTIGADHLTHLDIAEARFQAIAAKGGFVLAPDGGLPTGQIDITAARLPATQSGAARATIALLREGTTPLLRVTADITGLAVQGAKAAHGVLNGTVTDPLGADPQLSANLVVQGLQAGATTQTLRLDATGPQNALALRLAVTGTPAVQATAVQAAATLDATTNQLRLSSLQGTIQGQTLRLAAPAILTYAPQISLGPTRLSLGASTLDLSGRLAPSLDLTATAHAVPAELARLFDPTMVAEGRLDAEARLTGTTAKPGGTLRFTGSGLRVRTPPGLPPARLDLQATLESGRARLRGTADAGATHATLSGSLPIAQGAYDLTAQGSADLSLLDAALAPSGAQARGQLGFNLTLTGTDPTPSGTITLHRGTITAPTQGARLSDIEATAHAGPTGLILDRLTAKAGAGTLEATGRLGLTDPMPIDLHLAARRASPLSSDLLAGTLDADLTLSGALQTAMTAAGRIDIARADINIPQRLPANLPQLVLRQHGPAPKPSPPPVPIALDIALHAPGQIFVRGRGLDAELGGDLHLGGTAAAPKPEGGFTLRRGQFSLAGQNLTFSRGAVGFDGQLPIDPSLDFTATGLSTAVAATLTISGHASAPRIALSSVPELPQDEVLAQLLFRRSAAELGPLQLAQIAAGLAQIADVGGAGGIDPLGRLRKGLGLDVLSVGGNPGAGTSVEAGRTIARGVYLGAKQSTSGSGSQATVRIDLATGLRLEADLGVAPAQATTPTPGAPPTGNQVGITYEFEY